MDRLKAKSQLELPLARHKEPDRNLSRGGRSFYFFDFDDNVAFLTTPIFLFHKDTGDEVRVSSQEFATHSKQIGRKGPFSSYQVDHDPTTGSFRAFRDRDMSWLERMCGQRQIFVEDLSSALGNHDSQWKGPSWNCFYHAVFNARPVALITARGHHPDTLRSGIKLWVDEGYLPHEPNYLALYPVNHPETKTLLGSPDETAVPQLKQRALRHAVNMAKRVYGNNPHHRFGMSDDDPGNIEWITREMRELKRENPQMSFFVIQTDGESMHKREIFVDHIEDYELDQSQQLTLFEE